MEITNLSAELPSKAKSLVSFRCLLTVFGLMGYVPKLEHHCFPEHR